MRRRLFDRFHRGLALLRLRRQRILGSEDLRLGLTRYGARKGRRKRVQEPIAAGRTGLPVGHVVQSEGVTCGLATLDADGIATHEAFIDLLAGLP